MEKKISYSVWTGLWKSLKNTLVIVGIPALILFLDKWTEIIPNKWNVAAAPVMGFISYFVKNWVELGKK